MRAEPACLRADAQAGNPSVCVCEYVGMWGRSHALTYSHTHIQGGSPMTGSIARKVVQSFQRLPAAAGVAALSECERAVLDLLGKGYIYKEIGVQLEISHWTVSSFVQRIYQKLHVNSRAEALAKYRGSGR